MRREVSIEVLLKHHSADNTWHICNISCFFFKDKLYNDIVKNIGNMHVELLKNSYLWAGSVNGDSLILLSTSKSGCFLHLFWGVINKESSFGSAFKKYIMFGPQEV